MSEKKTPMSEHTQGVHVWFVATIGGAAAGLFTRGRKEPQACRQAPGLVVSSPTGFILDIRLPNANENRLINRPMCDGDWQLRVSKLIEN
jgi:hypothetical protein